ncbi:MAG: tripartite tricarboxylate transporter substrate binding protein BugD [Hyphomicrobiales bacterium]|nr:tripartite tricarboxylate transporter substrate binding protein BugD [Hyphomicrobiales bacterium]
MRGPILAALGSAVVWTSAALAQPAPSKPVTIVVPFAAGGPADALSRMLAERMQRTLGQSFVIENVTGAAGSLGVARVARAAPDGSTIGIGHLGTHVFNGALYHLQYDLVNDLEPIALLPANLSVIVGKKDIPATDLRGLIAWLKANPDQATAGTAGIGSVAHLATLYFQNMTGATLRVVPYRGGGAAVNDLVAGHVSFFFDQLTASSIELYRAGKSRPFAVAAPARLPQIPDVPTVDEAGVPGLYVSTWYGFWAPKGTPQEIISRLNAAVVEALADPAIRKRLDDQAAQVPAPEQQTPAALGAHQRAEIAKWWPIIKASNIKVD